MSERGERIINAVRFVAAKGRRLTGTTQIA
ncbi:MAG: hypothetical protein QOC92_2244 [Acidimicrobiaceae bacterium]